MQNYEKIGFIQSGTYPAKKINLLNLTNPYLKWAPSLLAVFFMSVWNAYVTALCKNEEMYTRRDDRSSGRNVPTTHESNPIDSLCRRSRCTRKGPICVPWRCKVLSDLSSSRPALLCLDGAKYERLRLRPIKSLNPHYSRSSILANIVQC